MYTIIYKFNIKSNTRDAFINAWKEMTLLIKEHEGGLGSRLHIEDQNTFIAYAQWSDKETFEKSGNNLPQEASDIRSRMRSSCISVERLMEMAVVEDMLVK